jgi:hypothetical protein
VCTDYLLLSTTKIYKFYEFTIQISSDTRTLDSVLSILRECVAAKTPWRAPNLQGLVDLCAAERIAATLTRTGGGHPSPDRGTVSAFWVLSALATKGKSAIAVGCCKYKEQVPRLFLSLLVDSKFCLRIRLCGALPLMTPVLKLQACRALGLYPVLQVKIQSTKCDKNCPQ